MLESELFGHEKGAFTGADHRRIGKFEQVNGGTLLLDEIGDMSLVTQAKALRLLQEQQFERVGGNTTVKTDVRIIAATNQELHHLVETGRFRLDLLYRLNGFTIELPPLRERRDDIPLLADHFLATSCRELQRSIPQLTDAVRQRLQEHTWPGNVRELQNALRFAVVHATGNAIELEDLPAELRMIGGRRNDAVGAAENRPAFEERALELLSDGQNDVYRRLQAEFDESLLALAWKHTGGNQARMSELLGLSRMTLRSKLRACGLLSED